MLNSNEECLVAVIYICYDDDVVSIEREKNNRQKKKLKLYLNEDDVNEYIARYNRYLQHTNKID